jgi:hypothetical protein
MHEALRPEGKRIGFILDTVGAETDTHLLPGAVSTRDKVVMQDAVKGVPCRSHHGVWRKLAEPLRHISGVGERLFRALRKERHRLYPSF